MVAHLWARTSATSCTINEPNIVARFGYEEAIFAPGRRDRDARLRATDNFIAAHRGAVDVVKSALPETKVGLTWAMSDYQAQPGGEDRLVEMRSLSEDVYLEAA